MTAPATLRAASDLRGISPADWNALAGEGPFMRHEFLSALLETGCASERTGWTPQFLTLWRGPELAGAMPLFAKTHSYGEYVFDWSWAEAYSRHGLDYYPKLVCAVPFTPVTGPRVLARTRADRAALIRGALEAAREYSSLHVLFPAGEDADSLAEAGMLMRSTVQFHWSNAGYENFEMFLAGMSHKRRKMIRQERRRVGEAGVTVRRLSGAEIDTRGWEFFHRCYRHTYRMHHSSPYLNLEFFLRLGATMPENIVLILAERGDQPIAASLLMHGGGRMYGRHWGAVEHVPLLHFECCYYQPIEHAIEQGLTDFEGGAQGEHKLFRGLLPVETRSAHWLRDPRFSRAVEEFLSGESARIHGYVDELNEHTPFRNEAG